MNKPELKKGNLSHQADEIDLLFQLILVNRIFYSTEKPCVTPVLALSIHF